MHFKARHFCFALALTSVVSQVYAYDPDTLDKVQRCLMSVTATSGLVAAEEARRKVNCYRGTLGMADHCESSVTATMALRRDHEEQYKAQCRVISSK